MNVSSNPLNFVPVAKSTVLRNPSPCANSCNTVSRKSIPFAGAVIYGVPATPPPVVRQMQPGGAAEVAGLQPGDRVVAFDGNENPKWRTIADDALLSPGQPVPLEIERNGQRIKLTIKPTPHTEEGETVGLLDFVPDYGNLPIIVREVVPNSPAAENQIASTCTSR